MILEHRLRGKYNQQVEPNNQSPKMIKKIYQKSKGYLEQLALGNNSISSTENTYKNVKLLNKNKNNP